MPDGRAKELNPIPKPPVIEDWNIIDQEYYCACLDQWQEAEAQRKSYVVEPMGCKSCSSADMAHCSYPEECGNHWPKPGTIVEAEIIDENTVRVVKILES